MSERKLSREQQLYRHARAVGDRDRPGAWCPYPDCGFGGSDAEVDEHRTYAHRDEPQQGSNLSHRPH